MELKLFNKYSLKEIKVEDPGLKAYINLEPIIVPKTGGKNVKTKFWKSKYNIVERLINKLMVPGHRGKKHLLTSGHVTGKSQTVYKIIIEVFRIIEEKTKQNPVQVLVKAIENAAPREEITTIEYGGAKYPQAVEVAPQRRVDLALRQLVQGSYQRSYGKKQNIITALSDEIIKAFKSDQGSAAISKKLELERQADASR